LILCVLSLLNSKIKQDVFPLPRISDILDQMSISQHWVSQLATGKLRLMKTAKRRQHSSPNTDCMSYCDAFWGDECIRSVSTINAESVGRVRVKNLYQFNWMISFSESFQDHITHLRAVFD